MEGNVGVGLGNSRRGKNISNIGSWVWENKVDCECDIKITFPINSNTGRRWCMFGIEVRNMRNYKLAFYNIACHWLFLYILKEYSE
ncbi:hypothetical protein SETIT_1G127000v2 [Setaria italica]|uniref:Uncharacterized protein n=1 Tax=Setaria italica TaxID=4555 RepID=A0A368PKP4_SETIT|nr:hypothetical protein SETIT_1G127000v2 [Setaria italica]